MQEQFAQEFVTRLSGKVKDDELKTILQELEMFSRNYDIEKKETAIAQYVPEVPECYKTYLVSKKIEGTADSTLKTYDLYLQDFFQNVNKPLKEIATNDIRVYLYTLQQRTNIGNRSLDGKRLVINTFMNWCQEEGYIQKNPCKQIHPIKYTAKPREPLDSIELELVRDACKDYRERAIIETLYSTGCRVSELTYLKKADVDFSTGEVQLFGKGSKYRTSYINAKMEVNVKKYLFTRKDDCEYLFVTSRNPVHGMGKEAVEQVVRKIGERSGIGRHLYPHLIRHTMATDAVGRGMNVAEAQKILGHEKLDTTMIYAHVAQEDVRFAHKKYIV